MAGPINGFWSSPPSERLIIFLHLILLLSRTLCNSAEKSRICLLKSEGVLSMSNTPLVLLNELDPYFYS